MATARLRRVRILTLSPLLLLSTCQLLGLGVNAELLVLPQMTSVETGGGGGPPPVRLEAVERGSTYSPRNPVSLTWSSQPAGATFVQFENSVTVTVPASLAGNTVVKIIAKDGALSATAFLVFHNANTSEDRVVSGAENFAYPAVSLASGMKGTQCAADDVVAFIGSAPVGPFLNTNCPRTESLVFRSGVAPLIQRPATWTAGADVSDASELSRMIEIPLQVVIGVPQTRTAFVTTAFDTWLLYAEDVFLDMRAGISFPALQQTKIVEPMAPVVSCQDLNALPPSIAPHPDKLNFYFVGEIGPTGNPRGVYCAPNRMLLSDRYSSSSTIVHELGHALGLTAYQAGHTEGLWPYFLTDNIMAHTIGSETGGDRRYRLTLGQLYRMHVDGRSWIQHHGDQSLQLFKCPCNPLEQVQCPALDADVRPRPSVSAPPYYPSDCS